MKKTLLYLSVFALIGLASCGSDDDGDATPTTVGSVTFDGNDYSLTNGIFVDYGQDGDHYNYDFSVADASFNQSELFGDNILIYVELWSPSNGNFETGTFEFNTNPEPNDFYFEFSDIALDTNNDGQITEEDGFYSATGGTVKIEGTKPNYKLIYNIDFEGGRKLTGNISTTFIEVN